jgi:hypothetical protein
MPIHLPAFQMLPERADARVPMLPAEWLEETLSRARGLLHRDDPFMRALEGQREPVAELAWPGPGEES